MAVRYGRRDVLKLAGATVGIAALGGTAAAQSTNSGSWPQPGYDAGHTGYNPNGPGPAKGVAREWEFSTFASAQTNMQPMIDDGIAVLASRDFNVYGIDVATGEQTWSVDLGTEIGSTPAIADGTAFVAADGVLHALDLKTGTERWTYEHPDDDLNEVAMTYRDGKVFLPGIRAVNADDGSVAWTADSGVARVGVAVSDGTVYATESGTNRIYAYDIASGAREWRTRIDGRTAYDVVPVVNDGTLVTVTRSSQVVGVDAATGKSLWSFDAGESNRIASVPAIHDGTVYYGHSPKEGSESGTVSGTRGDVYALDAVNGDQLWHVETAGGVEANPMVTDGTVYVGTHGTEGGRLYAIEPGSGSVRWTYDTRDDIEAHTLAGNRLYVVTQDGYLTALTESSTTATTTAESNRSPTARFTFSPAEPNVGEEVTFDASASTDDGEISRYEWTFALNVDESVGGSGQQATHTYEEAGEYEVGLQVVDDDGATDRTSRTVRVGAASGSGGGETGGGSGGDGSGGGGGTQQRQRGFFSNSGEGPDFLENAFNLTVLGFMLSVAGIIHQMLGGR